MLARHIKEILRDKALVTPRRDGRTILREKDVMELELADMTSDITIINMRKIGSLSGVKDGEWTQICDFLLLFEDGDKDYAIFIELKKTLDENSKEKGKEQLRRSLPFLNYLHSVCELQYGTNFNEPIVKYTIVAARHSPRFDKHPVRERYPLPTENYKEISVTPFVDTEIRFNSLMRS